MVTMKELAQELNISPSTVSIVLNGRSEARSISDATRERVLRLAQKRGYQPNIAARRLKGGYGADVLQIAIFWALDFRASMVARFMEGVRTQLKNTGQKAQLVIHPYESGKLSQAQALVSASDCHAAIVCNASAEDICYLEQISPIIPTILYNRSSEKFSNASMDHAQIGIIAANAFSDNGAKSVMVISTDATSSEMDIRTHSFLAQAETRGLEVVGTYFCGGTASDSRDLITSVLRQFGRDRFPDSVFCGSSMIAHGVLRGLWENHISVPEEVRVIAVGNGLEEDDACTIPSLSVVKINMEAVAAECIHILLSVLHGGNEKRHSEVLGVEYLARESCGPLRVM